MNDNAAIMYRKWKKSTREDGVIVGYWPEDDNKYIVACPAQLVDEIVRMQNMLVDNTKKADELRYTIGQKELQLSEFEKAFEFMATEPDSTIVSCINAEPYTTTIKE